MLAYFLELSNFTPEQISELNTFIDGWGENIINYAEDNINPTAEGGIAEDSQAVDGDNDNHERKESGNSDSGIYRAAEGEEVNPYAASNADTIEQAEVKPEVNNEKQTPPELELVTVSTELATAKAKYDRAYLKNSTCKTTTIFRKCMINIIKALTNTFVLI